MKNIRLIFMCSIFILLSGTSGNQLSHCNSNADANKKWLFKLSIQVLPDVVAIQVQNLNGLMTLDENLVIEKRNEGEEKWIFAACPLWFCGTKETVLSREIKGGEISIVKWNKKLHEHCQTAPAGRYRALIKEHDGAVLAAPVEFIIGE